MGIAENKRVIEARVKALNARDSDEFITSIRKRVTPSHYWNLKIIGVDPAFQGKGFGGILLKAMLKRIDQENLPCYLELKMKRTFHFTNVMDSKCEMNHKSQIQK